MQLRSQGTWTIFLISFIGIVACQSAQDNAFSTLSFDSIFNATWDSQVRQLCAAAAQSIQTPSQSGGLIACYNVAALQASTGLFLGDLRLYTAGQSSLPASATIQTIMDFAKVAVVRNTTESQGSTVQVFRKRDEIPMPQLDLAIEAASHVESESSMIASKNFKRASLAAVASPQPGIKPILATAILGDSLIAPATLPGERRLAVQRRTASTPSLPNTFTSTSLNNSIFSPSGVVGQSKGIQVQTIQFLGMLNLDKALSNPDGSGVLGALLPSIALLVSNPGQAVATYDMNPFTKSFLTGVSGTGRPAGTFVLPGRRLGGADGSVSRIGLYMVGVYTIILLLTLFVGISTRWNLRRLYRSRISMKP